MINLYSKWYKKTFGEMNFEYKERISHRSIAFKKMKKFLKRISFNLIE